MSARSSAKRAIAREGEDLVLRQPVRIEYRTGANLGTVASSPISTASLLAVGAFLAGVSVVTLDAAAVTGLLVAGDRLVFAGHSQVYVVTGGPYAAAANVLASVSITPALVSNVADNEAVAVSFNGTDKAIKGYVSEAKTQFVDGTLSRVGDYDVLVAPLALEEEGITIVEENDLFLGASVATAKRAEILKIVPIRKRGEDVLIRLAVKVA